MSKQTLFIPKNALGSDAISKIRQTISDEINFDLESGTFSPSFDTVFLNNLDSNAAFITVLKDLDLGSFGLISDTVTTGHLETTSTIMNLTTNSNSNSIIATYICPRSNSVRQAGDSSAVVLAGSGYGITGYEGTKMEVSHDTLITNKIGVTDILTISGSAITTAAEIKTNVASALTLLNNAGQIKIGSTAASQGTNGAPAIAFSGATNTFNTGIYASAAGTLSMTCNGSQRFQLNSSSLSTMGTFRAQASGTVTAPAVQITDTNNGFYKITTAQIGLSTNGALRCDWDATRMNLAGALYLPNGSVTAPALTFTNDTSNNSGLYLIANDNIGLSINGGNVVSFSSTGATVAGLTTTTTLKVGTGKTVQWSDFGNSSVVASLAPGITSNVSVTFNSTAPTATGMTVHVNLFGGSNCQFVISYATSYTTTGFSLYFYNTSGATATNMQWSWFARV